MKKFILTLALTLSICFASFAQTSWNLVFYGTTYIIAGVTYSAGYCTGVTGNDLVIRPIPGDPFSFMKCNPNDNSATVQNCPAGLAFNPLITTCDFIENVAPSYPEFPWGDYE